MKIQRTTSEMHPEGWFAFCIGNAEVVEGEFKGKKTTRLKWACESTERKEDGSKFRLNVYTGVELSDDPRCKLKQLVDACGVDDLEDTDDLYGSTFAGKVEQGVGDKSGYANIVAFDTVDRVKPAKKTLKVKGKASEEDPFEQES